MMSLSHTALSRSTCIDVANFIVPLEPVHIRRHGVRKNGFTPRVYRTRATLILYLHAERSGAARQAVEKVSL